MGVLSNNPPRSACCTGPWRRPWPRPPVPGACEAATLAPPYVRLHTRYAAILTGTAPHRVQADTGVPLGDPSIHEDCLEVLRERLPLDRRYRHAAEGAENAVAHLAEMMVFGDSARAQRPARSRDLAAPVSGGALRAEAQDGGRGGAGGIGTLTPVPSPLGRGVAGRPG